MAAPPNPIDPKFRKKNGSLKVKWTAFYPYKDREGIDRIGKGRIFVIDGRELELFPVGVLCGILGRNRKAIYKWEQWFGFPQALYQVKDVHHCNRWYSRLQLAAIQGAYEACGGMRKKNRTKINQFIEAVRAVFYLVDREYEVRRKDAK